MTINKEIDEQAIRKVVRLLQELIGANEKDTYPIIKKELNSLVHFYSNQALTEAFEAGEKSKEKKISKI